MSKTGGKEIEIPRGRRLKEEDFAEAWGGKIRSKRRREKSHGLRCIPHYVKCTCQIWPEKHTGSIMLIIYTRDGGISVQDADKYSRATYTVHHTYKAESSRNDKSLSVGNDIGSVFQVRYSKVFIINTRFMQKARESAVKSADTWAFPVVCLVLVHQRERRRCTSHKANYGLFWVLNVFCENED